MEVAKKNITVIGLARTGVATANFLAKQGAVLTVRDQKTKQELEGAVQNLNAKVNLMYGSIEPDSDAELIILSPGVDINSVELDEARKNGTEIISELELASRFNKAPIIAITGTNGKTTTVTLVGEILKKAGKNTIVGGNIGAPFISLVDTPDVDWAVLEVSSFQLEGIKSFHPKIAAVLNITPDHLDRHKTIEHYTQLKERITSNQTNEDFLVLNMDDPLTLSLGLVKSAHKVFFSTGINNQDGVFIEDEYIKIRNGSSEKMICSIGHIKPAVRWQIENILAAVAITSLAGIDSKIITATLKEFIGLEHRMEWVRSVNGIDFINDSKGTNVGSVQKTLESLDRPVILILGGQDKASDFGQLKEIFKEKVKHMVLIGESRARIQKTLNGSFSYTQADTFEEAVGNAFSEAESGDIVLLSPGCASFDMFRDYMDRGNQFKKLVAKL
ncbi:MAG: UDP-N-acetylmuramoyl-L-alanine--D-glutamate ligase [Nitrospinales bacterium]